MSETTISNNNNELVESFILTLDPLFLELKDSLKKKKNNNRHPAARCNSRL